MRLSSLRWHKPELSGKLLFLLIVELFDFELWALHLDETIVLVDGKCLPTAVIQLCIVGGISSISTRTCKC